LRIGFFKSLVRSRGFFFVGPFILFEILAALLVKALGAGLFLPKILQKSPPKVQNNQVIEQTPPS
jgi:hypothetical protein